MKQGAGVCGWRMPGSGASAPEIGSRISMKAATLRWGCRRSVSVAMQERRTAAALIPPLVRPRNLGMIMELNGTR